MTETRTKKKPRRTKMVALQQVFHRQRMVAEGEVFMWIGDHLPPKETAIKAPPEATLGRAVPADDAPAGGAPEWTTTGFVERAGRAAGRDEAEEYDE